MELETSTASGGFEKAHIRKGYYAGVLANVKEFKDEKGEWKENKYGRQIILDFYVFHIDQETGDATKIATFQTGEDKNITKDVMLSRFLNCTYKDQKTGEHRTALTPNSRITKVFKALGWEGPDGSALKPKDYLGKWCELNINDYEQNDETFSTIEAINVFKGKPLEGFKLPENETVEKEVSEPISKDISDDPRVAELKEKLANGEITQKGYDMAISSMQGGN